MKLLIKGARVLDPANGVDDVLDILIENGLFTQIGQDLCGDGAKIFDARGLAAAPGLVDMHVHLRDPGQTHKEDILTGCMAAAAGGVTSLADMPNTKPVCDNAEIIRYMLEKARPTGVKLYPIAAVTKGQVGGALVDFEALAAAGAAAFSDDGRPVSSAGMMAKAILSGARVKRPVISHCEDLSLAGNGIVNEGEASRALGVAGIPAACEDVHTAREAALAAALSLPVHIAHVSTRGSVAIIRDFKRRGVKITAETCPHYFSLDESKTLARDADYRMKPPLRTRDDVAAVIEGLCDGTLDAIVTDHAPHAAQEKADFQKAPNGVVGLETSLAVGITYLVRAGRMPLLQLIEKMTVNPARILGIDAGTLNPGAPADLVLFDMNEKWRVEPDALHSKSHNTPYKGMWLYGRVQLTISGGNIIFAGRSFE